MSQQTKDAEWIKARVSEVNSRYTAHTALNEIGIEISNPANDEQIYCPFHSNKNTQAARYYGSSGTKHAHVFCFVCRQRWESVGIFAKANHIKFIEALDRLEKRFHISVKRKSSNEVISYSERDSNYTSSGWRNTEELITLAEKKLSRIRDKASLQEFNRIAYVIDNIDYDFKKSGKSSEDMNLGLKNVMKKINDILVAPEDPLDAVN